MGDRWQLPVGPSSIWDAVAAAHKDLLEDAPTPDGTWQPVSGLLWWRSLFADAVRHQSERISEVWEGPEVTVCPAMLETGAALSCRGLEVDSRGRFAKVAAQPRRLFFRGCRSSLMYGIRLVDLSAVMCDTK